MFSLLLSPFLSLNQRRLRDCVHRLVMSSTSGNGSRASTALSLIFTVGRRSRTHVGIPASRAIFVVIARREHRKHPTVSLQQLQERVAIEQDLDVPAEVVHHARQRDVVVRDHVSFGEALLNRRRVSGGTGL